MSSSMHHEENADFPTPYLVLTNEDYRILGPAEFGQPGLEAVEVLGPFVAIQASGPLITIHDSTVEAHLGIGHHLHRYNERLFYMLSGELDHDDPRNDIQGHIESGDVGLFTEGQRGMLHSEWNNGDIPTRVYILVYTTEPIPEQTSFTALREEDAPRYQESEGVQTKELVGSRSELQVHGDLRFFTDSTLEAGRALTVTLTDREGGLLSIRDGLVQLGDRQVGPGETILLPPVEGERSLSVTALSAARVFRIVHGPGHGFVRRDDASPTH